MMSRVLFTFAVAGFHLARVLFSCGLVALTLAWVCLTSASVSFIVRVIGLHLARALCNFGLAALRLAGVFF